MKNNKNVSKKKVKFSFFSSTEIVESEFLQYLQTYGTNDIRSAIYDSTKVQIKFN